MTRPLFAALVVAGCSVFGLAPAYGQTCMGGLPFSSAPLQAGARLGFSSNSKNYMFNVAKGTDQWFARRGIDFTSLSGLDVSKGIVVEGGGQYSLPQEKRLSFCPMATIVKLWGPNPAPEISLGELFFGFGGSVGFDA